MAIRTIRTDNDPILRKVCKEVTKFDEKLELLVNDMIETMHDADGVGLAAPQIGLLKRVVVIDLYDDEGPFEMINPVIVEEHGEQCEFEGCLSLPGRSGKVVRPAKVRVRFQDCLGDFYEVEGEELLARALCHEIDHLNGVLYIDKQIEEAFDEDYDEDYDEEIEE